MAFPQAALFLCNVNLSVCLRQPAPLPRGASGEETKFSGMPKPLLVRSNNPGSGSASALTERLFLYGKQQRDAKTFAALLDAACCVHLFHHGLDAGEADLRAVGAVLAGEDGIFKGKPGFAVLFDEADGNVLRRVGILSRFEVMLSRMR